MQVNDIVRMRNSASPDTLMVVEEVGPGWVGVRYMPGINRFRIEIGAVVRREEDQ